MGIFDDNPPNGYIRSPNKGWIVPKKTGTSKKLSNLKQENLELKERLEQLEAAVSEMANKKKK